MTDSEHTGTPDPLLRRSPALRWTLAAVQNFSDIEVVGINDLLEPDYLAYMLKYDSVHGRFQGDVAVDGNHLIVNGRRIRLTAVKNPADRPS